MEIRRNVPELTWRHVAGNDNPADIPSRGLDLSKLNRKEFWLHGPNFLAVNSDNWPKTHVNATTKDETSIAVENDGDVCDVKTETCIISSSLSTVGGTNLNNIFEIKRYSSLQKLLRITCVVIRFIKILQARITKSNYSCSLELTSDEIKRAKRIWIINEQCRIVENEKRFRSLKCALRIFVDKDGILRMTDRLVNSSLQPDAKFPILLEKDSYLTDLIILDCHKKVKHSKVKDTLNELRSTFWVPQGRRTVYRVLRSCTICNKFHSKAFEKMSTAPLPKFRVETTSPYTACGIDYLGALLVKDIFNQGNTFT